MQRQRLQQPQSQANDSKSSDSNSNSSAVDTNNQPAKNSEGRVIEWITQYLRDEWSRARSSSRSSNPEEWTSYGSGRSLTALRTRTSVCSAKGYQTSSSGQVAIRSAHIRAVVKSTCRGLRLVRAVLAGDPDPPVWSGGPAFKVFKDR